MCPTDGCNAKGPDNSVERKDLPTDEDERRGHRCEFLVGDLIEVNVNINMLTRNQTIIYYRELASLGAHNDFRKVKIKDDRMHNRLVYVTDRNIRRLEYLVLHNHLLWKPYASG